jgi:PAS domain S-box-containing protein
MREIAPSVVRSDGDAATFAAIASAAIRQATTFVGLCDAQLRPFFLNAAGREMVGLTAEADIASYQIADFFIEEQRDVVERVVVPSILCEGRWDGELCIRHFLNSSRQTEVRWSAFALRNEAGAILSVACFTADIAALKHAQRVLRDQQILLRSLLDNLPLGIGVYDQHGNLIHSNQRLRGYAGLTQLPSGKPSAAQRWRGYDAEDRLIPPERYPAARALRGETVMPGIDYLYDGHGGSERWLRVSAVPFRRECGCADQAVVVVQEVDDLKRTAERIEATGAALASQSRFLAATLSSIPDYVYAFDRQRRFAYVNPVTLKLFGLSAGQMLGRTFVELDYPAELADKLNSHIDRVLSYGVTVEDEVFYCSPTGHAAYYSFLWGPVHAEDGSVELVVGVSRETTERRALEERIRTSEARLRAATDLAGLGIYSWDPVTGTLDWDEKLRGMWGLPPHAHIDMTVFEAGIHADDLPHVRRAIAGCIDPSGNGRYNIEYRVVGRDDGITRHIATSGQTTFAGGRAVGFIGAAVDVTEQRRNEAAIRVSEAQFRSFAKHSSNLIWIRDTAAGKVIYRSAAYERIWGLPCASAPNALADWIEGVHPEDRQQVERAVATVKAGEVAQFEYRIVRPADGGVRWLRETSFPIPDENGTVDRIGGITEDLTHEDVRQVYVVSVKAAEARLLAGLVRALGYNARTFHSASAFLDLAPVLAPGCVLVDIRTARDEGLSVSREL